MPEQNTITGPDGQIFRPREVPTGLASHVKFVVREYELFNLELERMVESCRSSRDREDGEDGRRSSDNGEDRANLLGSILGLASRFDQPG